MKIAIVGSGLMGTATAYPLADNGHDVRLVGTHLDAEIIASCKEKHFHPRLKRELPERVRPFYIEEIGHALEGVEVIVSGVNSLGAHWIGQALAPHIRAGQTIIGVTKGLEIDEQDALTILPDVLRSELPAAVRDEVCYAAIGGPCIAGELAGRRPSCVVFGSRDGNTAHRLANVFGTSYYHIWPTSDLLGLEIGAAFKNAYTIAVGIAMGLLEQAGGVDESGAGMFNLAAATFAQGTTEIDQWLRIAGATTAFAHGLPGAGDLYVTSVGGRTIRLGKLLGTGHSFAEARQIMAGETLEGAEIIRVIAKALPLLEAKGAVMPHELPLMRKLIDIVVCGAAAELPLESYFWRRLT